MNIDIAGQRLINQGIANPIYRRPADIVSWLGAVQAQEYSAAKWALALRTREGAMNDEIERAFDKGHIIRTHVMRPTWHFVAPSDVRWMLDLTAGRVHRAMAYHHRRFGLEAATRTRAARILERALRDGQSLTRAELGAHLARAHIKAAGVRLALLTVYAELEGVICSGVKRGKQMTYALFEERVPEAPRLSRDEALAELTRRYFQSHGPATIRDFVWWSGLTAADAKRGLEMIRAAHVVIDERTYWSTDRTPAGPPPLLTVHLLPNYDEYLVAYRDLEAVPRMPGSRGRLQQALVVSGQVAGTWRTVSDTSGPGLDIVAERGLTKTERISLKETAALYERFLGMPISIIGRPGLAF